MLTVELKTPKNLDLSKSSLVEDETNIKCNPIMSHRAEKLGLRPEKNNQEADAESQQTLIGPSQGAFF
jgi:hypothetical protein